MTLWKKKLIILLCTVLPVLAALGFAVGQELNNEFSLEISLEGAQEEFLEYGQHYEPVRATASYADANAVISPINVDVKMEGTVNDQILGTYVVEYSAEFRGLTALVNRKIHVVDTQAPEITLVTNPDSYTFPGEPYVEEGFTATDNRDGDITSQVVATENDGVVTYTVSDSAGNTTTVTREIHYDDPIAPVLTLTGSDHIAMVAGKPYVDPGYSAVDNLDGDITSQVTVTGKVDGYMPGTYSLVYTVTDSYNNTVSLTRSVDVAPHPVQEYVANPEKVIYLTFDDGPGPRTPDLLDILYKYNVKATFFVINTAYIDTIKRAYDEDHTIAVHSESHDFHKIYASEEAFFTDFTQMQTIVNDLIGVAPTMLRFPGGTSNTISRFNRGIMTRLSAAVKEKGYRYFDWNVDSNDAGGASTADEVFNNVIKGIGERKMAVVLQHDIKDFSIDAVERIINWGLQNGYTFMALDENSPVCEHDPAN